MNRILDRYILREIAFPFFTILFILTFVLLTGKILQLMDLMVNKGVRLFHILLLIFYLIPSFLLFTVPIALLVGVMIAMGRMSADNEITVIKASGVSLYGLARPFAVFTGAAFIFCLFTSYNLVPWGNYATKTLLFDLARQRASIGIKEKVFNDDFRGILIYADRVPVSGEYLEGVLIQDNREGVEPGTITAAKARLVMDAGKLAIVLRLEEGSTHYVGKDLSTYRVMTFSRYDIRLDLSSSLTEGGTAKSSTEMTVKELKEKMASPGLKEEERRELAIELHKKLSTPFSCLVFGVLAVPLGIRKHRSAKAWGFTMGIGTVLLYYLLRLGGEALVETGRLPVIAGVWMPNLLFGAGAVYLFWKAAGEKTLFSPLRSLRP